MVISRRAVAIASESVVIDQEYPDETLEPDRKSQIPDVLWRSIRAPRGGRRGLATKVRHIKEGIAQGYYQGNYPFVTRDGLEYAKQWNFQVSTSVLQGATVCEIETSSSEEEVHILERPAAKARPTPKASEPVPILERPAAKALKRHHHHHHHHHHVHRHHHHHHQLCHRQNLDHLVEHNS